MSDTESRSRGVLTEDDREYLRGEKDYEHVQTESNVKSRIRERTYNSILDGQLLWHRLPSAEREKIFAAWHEDAFADEGEWGLVTKEDRSRRDQFRRALTNWIAFIYAGVENEEHLGFDFENILTGAIANAEATRNRQVVDVSLDVEYRSELDTDALLARFDEGDPTLSWQETEHLREEGVIDEDDLEDYRRRITGGRDPIGMVDPNEIADEFDVETDED